MPRLIPAVALAVLACAVLVPGAMTRAKLCHILPRAAVLTCRVRWNAVAGRSNVAQAAPASASAFPTVERSLASGFVGMKTDDEVVARCVEWGVGGGARSGGARLFDGLAERSGLRDASALPPPHRTGHPQRGGGDQP